MTCNKGKESQRETDRTDHDDDDDDGGGGGDLIDDS